MKQGTTEAEARRLIREDGYAVRRLPGVGHQVWIAAIMCSSVGTGTVAGYVFGLGLLSSRSGGMIVALGLFVLTLCIIVVGRLGATRARCPHCGASLRAKPKLFARCACFACHECRVVWHTGAAPEVSGDLAQA